ncbi:hypothetical protein EVAR_65819_1 [Eumeta japonica]|uniref:Uncharacterized protein n=1 Tax=Eumeta variegata TaxID=151549 RepID=A0A4C1ZK14_EUMVA|nr:hypothetical protein EVAR_65819_1 [Eumeta japonica]
MRTRRARDSERAPYFAGVRLPAEPATGQRGRRARPCCCGARLIFMALVRPPLLSKRSHLRESSFEPKMRL